MDQYNAAIEDRQQLPLDDGLAQWTGLPFVAASRSLKTLRAV